MSEEEDIRHKIRTAVTLLEGDPLRGIEFLVGALPEDSVVDPSDYPDMGYDPLGAIVDALELGLERKKDSEGFILLQHSVFLPDQSSNMYAGEFEGWVVEVGGEPYPPEKIADACRKDGRKTLISDEEGEFLEVGECRDPEFFTLRFLWKGTSGFGRVVFVLPKKKGEIKRVLKVGSKVEALM